VFTHTKHGCCGRQASVAMASWRGTDKQKFSLLWQTNPKYKSRFVIYREEGKITDLKPQLSTSHDRLYESAK